MKQLSVILSVIIFLLFTGCTPGKPTQGDADNSSAAQSLIFSVLPESSQEISSAGLSSREQSSVYASSEEASSKQTPVSSNRQADVTSDKLSTDDAFSAETDLINQLKQLLVGYGDNIAVYYEDLETGRKIEFDSNRVFHPASVIKVPYMMYIYELAEQGKANLNRTFTYTEKNFREGAGKIAEMPYGSTFSTEKLIEYSIRFSDNIAFYMLRDVYTPSKFQSYAKELGVSVGANAMNRITARDCAIYYHRVYDKAKEGNANKLLGFMKKTKYNQQIQKGVPDITIAHKYGWWNGNFHDAAIVYDKHPYMLIIFTNCDPESEPSFEIFKSVTEVIQLLHTAQAR